MVKKKKDPICLENVSVIDRMVNSSVYCYTRNLDIQGRSSNRTFGTKSLYNYC